MYCTSGTMELHNEVTIGLAEFSFPVRLGLGFIKLRLGLGSEFASCWKDVRKIKGFLLDQ